MQYIDVKKGFVFVNIILPFQPHIVAFACTEYRYDWIYRVSAQGNSIVILCNIDVTREFVGEQVFILRSSVQAIFNACTLVTCDRVCSKLWLVCGTHTTTCHNNMHPLVQVTAGASELVSYSAKIMCIFCNNPVDRLAVVVIRWSSKCPFVPIDRPT